MDSFQASSNFQSIIVQLGQNAEWHEFKIIEMYVYSNNELLAELYEM